MVSLNHRSWPFRTSESVNYTGTGIVKINSETSCNIFYHKKPKKLCVSLERVEEDVEGFAFDAVVLDDDARAADDLTCGAFLVELAEAGPFAKGHLRVHLHQVDFVVSAESFDEFAVLLFVAVLGEHAEVCKTFVKSLGSLVEATGKAVVDERVLEHLVIHGGREVERSC